MEAKQMKLRKGVEVEPTVKVERRPRTKCACGSLHLNDSRLVKKPEFLFTVSFAIMTRVLTANLLIRTLQLQRAIAAMMISGMFSV